MGDAARLAPVWKCQSGLPVLASSAARFPSRIAPNTTPPAVASTPLVSELWKILKSHVVRPLSGSIALMPADGGGSFAPRDGGTPRPAPPPTDCLPRSYLADPPTYS